MSVATKTFYDRLSSVAGADVAAIYAMSLPADATFPCLVYAQVYGGDGLTVSGSNGDTYRLRFQVDIYHSVFSSMMNIRAKILNGFHAWTVPNIILESGIDMDIPYEVDELETRAPALYRHIVDIGLQVAYNMV